MSCLGFARITWKNPDKTLRNPCITKGLATCQFLGLIFVNKVIMVDPVLGWQHERILRGLPTQKYSSTPLRWETLLLTDRLPHSLTPNNIEETESIQFQSPSMILLWRFLWVCFKITQLSQVWEIPKRFLYHFLHKKNAICTDMGVSPRVLGPKISWCPSPHHVWGILGYFWVGIKS